LQVLAGLPAPGFPLRSLTRCAGSITCCYWTTKCIVHLPHSIRTSH